MKRIYKIRKAKGHYERDCNEDLDRIEENYDEKEISRSQVMDVLSEMLEFARTHPNCEIDEGMCNFYLFDLSEDGMKFDEIGIIQRIED